MKPFKSKLRVLALAAGSLAITALSANAANSSYAAGDLVLYFQQYGNSNTLYVDLGAATTYRGAATGPDVANILNIIDINTQLNAAFGGSWASLTNLYMGVAGVYSSSTNTTAVVNGDPNRSIYVGQSRDAAGTVGSVNSAGYSGLSNTNMTQGSNNIIAMNSPFADAAGTNGYNGAAIVSPTSVSNIDNQNPFLTSTIQDTGFGIFAGGVQQAGTAGTFAANFGPVSNVEFALDLYRIVATDSAAGMVGQGESGILRTGTYEGSFTLSSDGKVSFVNAVPEPSTYALFGCAAVVIGFVAARRRKSNA